MHIKAFYDRFFVASLSLFVEVKRRSKQLQLSQLNEDRSVHVGRGSYKYRTPPGYLTLQIIQKVTTTTNSGEESYLSWILHQFYHLCIKTFILQQKTLAKTLCFKSDSHIGNIYKLAKSKVKVPIVVEIIWLFANIVYSAERKFSSKSKTWTSNRTIFPGKNGKTEKYQ